MRRFATRTLKLPINAEMVFTKDRKLVTVKGTLCADVLNCNNNDSKERLIWQAEGLISSKIQKINSTDLKNDSKIISQQVRDHMKYAEKEIGIRVNGFEIKTLDKLNYDVQHSILNDLSEHKPSSDYHGQNKGINYPYHHSPQTTPILREDVVITTLIAIGFFVVLIV